MDDPEWDDEVDVVCTDTGLAGLATAISAADEDGDVFLARASTASGRRWFGCAPAGDEAADWGDDETDAYFGELTADLDLTILARRDAELPVRVAGDAVPVRRRPVPAFEGSRLRDWAARCIPSPTGYLYTQVAGWRSTTMDCGDGDLVKVTEIGALDADDDDPIRSVGRWLAAQARDRGLAAVDVTRFDRLVFEEGEVTGAVFSTPTGALAVRARHGVLICPSGEVTGASSAVPVTGDDALRVALVGKEASRFGRVELLSSDVTRPQA